MESRFDTLILGGTLATPEGLFPGDVGIIGGRIAEVGDLAGADAAQTVDARRLHVFAGAIDTQVHFREPGMEHKEDLESGSRAAVAGGVTTYFEMPNTAPPTTDAGALADKLSRAYGRSWANYAFFVGATAHNTEGLAELEVQPGTPGVKIFAGSSTGDLLVEDDATLERVLRSGRYRCAVHSEDEPRLRARRAAWGSGELAFPGVSGAAAHPLIRDSEAAALCTRRLLRIVAETRRPLHILHISTADELDLIADARRRGLPVTCEATPQHLWFAAPEAYERLGAKAQMNPPIRDLRHRDALRAALRAGFFDVAGSDHAPHTEAEKSKPYPDSPSGMPGVQTLLPVLATLALRDGLIGLADVARLLGSAPAALYGVKSKGRLAPGFDADVALLDAVGTFEVGRDWLQSKCGWSPFEGERLHGRPVHVFVGGAWTVRDGALHGPPQGTPVEFER